MLARVRAHEREIAETEKRIHRLTDLAVAGGISNEEYIERRAVQLARRAEVERLVAEPRRELDAWCKAVREVVAVGSTALAAFRDGGFAERRELLGRVCSNLVVTERRPALVLRFPFTLLTEERPAVVDGPKGRPNLPPPEKIVRSVAKNARLRPGRERAFAGWWTKLCDVRTFLVGSVAAPTAYGDAPPRAPSLTPSSEK